MAEVASTALSSNTRKRKPGLFGKGSIVRIFLQNFLTYDQCTFRLNPKLNVIIGPNGTGKSSIVCAICLGLGGKTSFLARAKELGEFIKHGKDKAVIEIELSNTPNDVIRREIGQTSNGKATSVFYLNGSQSNVRQVEEVVAKHNIKLSNLCQFLPQERVADFAKMNKIELLENTELAVCPPQMLEDHKWLKQYRATEKEMEIKKNSDQEYLDKLIQKNQRVEQEAIRLQEKTLLVDKLNTLDKKRSWTVYEESRKEYKRCKEACKALKQRRSAAQRVLQPLRQKKDEIQEKIVGIDRNVKKMGDELKLSASSTKSLHEEIGEVDEQVSEKWDELKERKQDEDRRVKKIEQYTLLISGWRDELKQMPDAEVRRDLEELNGKIRATVTEIASAEQDCFGIKDKIQAKTREIKHCEGNLAELNNMSKRRLDTLRRKAKDCYNAIMWLRANKGMFKSTIHEPIILTIDMVDSRHARLVENHISFRDMVAFVCEDAADNDKFIREVREKQGLKVNVVQAPRDANGELQSSALYQPRRELGELEFEDLWTENGQQWFYTPKGLLTNTMSLHPMPIRQWGFTSYMRELFKAPDAVMAYLCKQYGVHNIPIGSERTKKIVDRVTRSSGVSTFYIPQLSPDSPGSRYSVKRSKYSSNSVVGNRPLKSAEFLNIKVDQVEIGHIEEKMKTLKQEIDRVLEHLKELTAQRKSLEKTHNKLLVKKKELQQKSQSKRSLETKISLKENALRELENFPIDLASVKREIQQSVKKILIKKQRLIVTFVGKIKACVDTSIAKGVLQLHYTQCLRQRTNIENKIRQLTLKNSALLQKCEEVEEAKAEAGKRAKKLFDEASAKTNGHPDHLKKTFSSFPDDLTEIDTVIHELQAKLDCCGHTDPKVFEEFKQRKKEIEAMKKRVNATEQSMVSKRDEMDTIKARWLKPLEKLVSRLNSRFAKYFEQMGCAGEVDLHAENPDDYDKYGIRIRVKFRASSTLQELDPFRQSGGERSVSTMLYLVALQSLHNCPFRLVDEINQGMDPHNERRVFEVIVNSSSEQSVSQYFLITPKLLPNLTYNRHMSVHCVYNGPSMLPHSNWKIARFTRKRRLLKYEDDEGDDVMDS